MNTLSSLITKEKKNSKINVSKSSRIQDLGVIFSEPGIGGISLIFGLVLFFFGISIILIHSIDYLNCFKIDDSSGDILQAIITLLLGVLIFSAERFQEDRYSTRVLLGKSGLWGLTLGTVTTLFLYFLGDIIFQTEDIFTKSGLIVSGLLLIWLIYAVGKVIYLILNPDLFKKEKDNFFYRKIDYLNDRSIDKRIGQNIFLKRLKDDPFVEYALFGRDEEWEKDNLIPVRVKSTGYITDINFDALNGINKLQVNGDGTQKIKKLVLRKNYLDKVQEGDILGYIPTESLRKNIEKFYTIGFQINLSDIKEDINVDLENLVHSIGDRIIDGNALRLESLYSQLSQYIIHHSKGIVGLNVKLNVNKANDFIGGIFDDGIGIYGEIQELLWKLYRLTLNSSGSEVYSEFISFIYSLIFYSINKNDYGLLSILSVFMPKFYGDSQFQNNPSIAEHIRVNNDNFFKFYLYPKTKKLDIEEDKEMLLHFFALLIRRFLRVAVDSKNLEQFSGTIKILNSVDRYDRDKSLEKVKGDMLFGFVGWIFKKLTNSTDDSERELYRNMIIQLLNTFRTTFSEWLGFFIDSREISKEDTWNCGDWDLPHDGEVYSIDNTSGPEKFFLLGLFQKYIARDISLDGIEMPVEVRYLNLDQWLNNQDWINVFNVPTVTVENTDKIRMLLEKMKAIEIQQSRSRRLTEDIPEEKVSKFFADISEGYNKASSFLRTVFRISKNPQSNDNTQAYGFNQFIEKIWFVDSSHSIHGFGEGFGENLGDGQEELVLKALKEKSQSIEVDNDPELIKQKIKELSKNMKDPIIIIFGTENYEILEMLLGNNIQWGDNSEERGKISNIPTYECFDKENDSSAILILDKEEIEEISIGPFRGSWIKSWGSESRVDGFYVEFEDMSRNREIWNEIQLNTPQWILDAVEEEKYDSVESYLKDRILFKIFFSLTTKIGDKIGYIIKFR